MVGFIRQVRAELRVIGGPVAVVSLGMLAGLALLLLFERGQGPFIVYEGESHTWKSVPAVVALTNNLVVTWLGVLLVPFAVASGFTTRLTHSTEELCALIEPNRWRRAGASFAATLIVLAAVALPIAATIGVATTVFDSGGPATSPTLNPTIWATLPLMAAVWWSFSIAVSLVVRSPPVTAIAPVALVFVCLPLSNLGGLHQWLPTTWLGRITGVGVEGTSLVSLWSSTGGLLGSQWSPDGPSWIPLVVWIAFFVGAAALLSAKGNYRRS